MASPSRRPRWVYDVGDEPDPRFSLANERTFLAWVRTGIAIAAAAVAMHSFRVPDTDWLRVSFVLVMLFLSVTCTTLAWARWARVERAMRRREPLPSGAGGSLLAGGTLVLCLLVVLALVI